MTKNKHFLMPVGYLEETHMKEEGFPGFLHDGIYLKRQIDIEQKAEEIVDRICKKYNIAFSAHGNIGKLLEIDYKKETLKLNVYDWMFEHRPHMDVFLEKIKEEFFFTDAVIRFEKPVDRVIIKMEVN